jgi:integrase
MKEMSRKTFRLVIVTPELLEKVNPKNLELGKKFLKEKNTRSSDGTIKGYESDLNIFWCYNLENNDNKFFVDIRKIEFADFFSYCMSELKWSSARFGRMRSCLSSFSQFIEKFYDDSFPMFKNVILKSIESIPKNPVREKTILSEEQVDGLMKYLSVELNEPQEACLLALAIGSGARISELLRFTTDIIDENNTAFEGLFIETLKPVKTKGRSKMGKMLYKYIIKDAFLPYYKTWLAEREKILNKNNKQHNYLFIKKDGSPAELGTIRSWQEKWETFLGVPFYAHCLRHYLVTRLARLGMNQDLIVELMGWSSSEMFKVYSDLTAKDREWKELEKLKGILAN